MSTISTNAIQSVAATLDLGVQGNIKAKMNADNTFSSVIPGFGDTQFPEFKCRAWVNWVGSATNGSQAIRASGNISSVVRNNTGAYVINFTSPMPDANYALSASGHQLQNVYATSIATTNDSLPTTTACGVRVSNDTGAPIDAAYNHVTFFR